MIEDYKKRSTYWYDLPQKLIAQTPLDKRDFSRMLVYSMSDRSIEHKHFYDVVDYFKKGDVLVLNKSRVLPARLLGIKEKTGAKIEVLLQKRKDLNCWKVIAKPTKRLNKGTIVNFSNELSGEFVNIGEYGCCEICFKYSGNFEEILDKIGVVPLPPYIHEKLKNEERYQTVYSKELGSSAAPTAGLHFTEEILQKLRDKGVEIVEVLLHVGLGTFRPVKEDNICEHKMHSEHISISSKVAKIISDAKKESRRVIACGTTSMRVLESMAKKSRDFEGYELVSGQKDTDIFIYPPYKFKITDGLITNFHLPESTLLMLISAFVGVGEVKKVYSEAIKKEYRFFSFGDVCLFLGK